jgi:3-hydroxyacyl-[acyl-carrier-protein] dehydratase
MAQACGILMLETLRASGDASNDGSNNVYFTSIDNARFKKMVTPGDTLIHEIEILQRRSKIAKLSCKTFVKDALATEATIGIMI